jgi:hypothetical protein
MAGKRCKGKPTAETQNNLVQWLTFFLVGVLETAGNSIQTFHEVMKLRSELEKKRIITLGKKVPLAMQLVRYLYTKPIVDASEVTKVLAVNISTANRLIQDFETRNPQRKYRI